MWLYLSCHCVTSIVLCLYCCLSVGVIGAASLLIRPNHVCGMSETVQSAGNLCYVLNEEIFFGAQCKFVSWASGKNAHVIILFYHCFVILHWYVFKFHVARSCSTKTWMYFPSANWSLFSLNYFFKYIFDLFPVILTLFYIFFYHQIFRSFDFMSYLYF